MGMFTQQSLMESYDDFVVEANESYKGAPGAYRAMTEAFQNSFAVFESCIGLDFMEVAAVNEDASSEEFEIVQEGFIGDFFNKIKEFLKKLIEKIKGIVSSFLIKLNGTFCRDNKALVNKYKSEVLKKQSQLEKMKYKWMPLTSDGVALLKNGTGNASKGQFTPELAKAYADLLKEITYDRTNRYSKKGEFKKIDSDKMKKDSSTINDIDSNDALKKIKEDLNDNTYLENDLGTLCGQSGGTELGEFAKEFHDYLCDAEEEFEGFDDSDAPSLSDIMLELSTGKKTTDAIQKLQRNQEKETKEMIKKIEQQQKQVHNAMPSDKETHNTNLSKYNAILSLAMTAATQISTVETKYFACAMDEFKKYLARCKKVFVQAAAYRPKANNESAILAEALGESAEYEVCEYFDNFVID